MNHEERITYRLVYLSMTITLLSIVLTILMAILRDKHFIGMFVFTFIFMTITNLAIREVRKMHERNRRM